MVTLWMQILCTVQVMQLQTSSLQISITKVSKLSTASGFTKCAF